MKTIFSFSGSLPARTFCLPRLSNFIASAFLFLLSLVCTTTARSQTQWTKHTGNPVLTVGSAGVWDDEAVLVDKVILDGSVYKMWYSGFDGTYWRMGYATSPDGVTWTKHPSNPILDIGPASWNSQVVYRGKVIFANSQYKMWYTGSNSNQTNEVMGYASSLDGISWTKTANPILTGGPSTWDAGQVGRSSVMGPDMSGGFKMWFSGFPTDYSSSQIGYATATNESTWTKFGTNPVLTPGASGSWDDLRVQGPSVLNVGGAYRMWYVGTRSTVSAARIGYATSSDGINWTKSNANPVLTLGPSAWDGVAVAANDVLFDGTKYKMWYSGFDGTYWRIGYAEAVVTSVATILSGPSSFSLYQNYPNPFNPSTKIRFSVPHQTHASLKVFDVLGREVAVLMNEELGAGTYEAPFDGIRLSSGVYYYQLQAREFVQTKKLMLVR